MVDTEVAKKNPQKDTVGFFFFYQMGSLVIMVTPTHGQK